MSDTEKSGPDLESPAFVLHRDGKMSIAARVRIRDAEDLALAYTPGVAEICRAIVDDPSLHTTHTWVGHAVAVVTDGSAVLGLGDIGPKAAMPVMEGKAVLFKEFSGVDAVPICLDTTDTDEIVETVARLAPSFAGINLEDISAPRCFEIEDRLKERLDIPVFHDDQHGTAIVVLAALKSALRLVGKNIEDIQVIISGAGAAGVAVAKIMTVAGCRLVAVCDSQGLINTERDDLNDVKQDLATWTNPEGWDGSPARALRNADVFIGVSGGEVPEDDIASMADDAIVFALANPQPEVHPDVARKHVRVVATGRSDFPNQINNVLAFPGIFRGALDARAAEITEDMKLAAADALAALVGDDLSEEYVIPSPFDPRVASVVADAVRRTAEEDPDASP